MRKRPLWIIALVLVFFGVIVGIYLYENKTSYQDITVTLKPVAGYPATAKLYKYNQGKSEYEPSTAIKQENYIADLQLNNTLRVKRGTYVIAVQNDANYQDTTKGYMVDENTKDIPLNLQLNDTALKDLAVQESASVNNALNQSITKPPDYKIDQGVLLLDGTWYVTTVSRVTDGSFYSDIYRVVAHKEDNTWKVVTNPSLSLSSLDYPDIPRAVLSKANNLGRDN